MLGNKSRWGNYLQGILMSKIGKINISIPEKVKVVLMETY